MTRLIVRYLLALILVLSYASLLCLGQSAKQPRILDSFQKKSDSLNYAIFNGQRAPTKDLLSDLEGQMVWDEARPEPSNPMGQRLRFVPIDEPGKDSGKGPTRYRVFADGAPENKVYAMGTWLVSQGFVPDYSLVSAHAGVPGARNVYVNARGLVMYHKPKPEEARSSKLADELEVTPVAASGEPVRYMLDSLDNELQIVGTLVPHPVVAEDEGCRIEVRVAQPDETAVLIFLDGFPLKAKIPVVLQSANETVTEVVIPDSESRAVIAGFPHVPGKTQGTFKVTAEGANCLPSVELPWVATGSTPKNP
jgi:hypothetical protein